MKNLKLNCANLLIPFAYLTSFYLFIFGYLLQDLNSPLLFGRLNGLSSDSTIDILYQLGTTQDPGTKDRYIISFLLTYLLTYLFIFRKRAREGETSVHGVDPPTGDLAHNSLMFPDWESNR